MENQDIYPFRIDKVGNPNHDEHGRFTYSEGGVSGDDVSEDLLERIRNSGGFSYQVVKECSPTTGYMVSPYKGREQKLDAKKVEVKNIKSYISKNKDVLSKPDHYFGAWVDKKNVYFDTSIRYANKSDALKAAKENHQLAIFSVKDKKTIYANSGNIQGKKMLFVQEKGDMDDDKKLILLRPKDKTFEAYKTVLVEACKTLNIPMDLTEGELQEGWKEFWA